MRQAGYVSPESLDVIDGGEGGCGDGVEAGAEPGLKEDSGSRKSKAKGDLGGGEGVCPTPSTNPFDATFSVRFSSGEGGWFPRICEECTQAASDRAERAKSVFKVQ